MDNEKKEEEERYEIPADAFEPTETVHQEDEQFEWGEIIRGRVFFIHSIEALRSLINYRNLGLTDIQTWLTGCAYFGLIVSLYSYSLFLWVNRMPCPSGFCSFKLTRQIDRLLYRALVTRLVLSSSFTPVSKFNVITRG